MINCPRCNSVLSDDAKICPYCNTRIGSNGSFQQPQQTWQPRINEVSVNQNNSGKRGLPIAEIIMFVFFGMPAIFIIFVMITIFLLGTLSEIKTNVPVEKTIDGGIIQEDGSVVYSHKLTIDKLYELANWEDDLTWEHFGIYDYTDLKYDKQTGYQVITYSIKDKCHTRRFVISGIKDQKPDSMLFYDSYGDSFGTEIRDAKEFEKAKKALKFDGCYSTY